MGILSGEGPYSASIKGHYEKECPGYPGLGEGDTGLFSVSSAYECLSKHGKGNNDEVFKLLWKVKAFPNVLVTA